MKEEKHSYIKGLLHGIGTLLTGMKVTGREFFLSLIHISEPTRP